MWTWSLNWNEINSKITVGSCPKKPSDLQVLLKKVNMSAMLCLQHDEDFTTHAIDWEALRDTASKLEITLIRAPMRDFDSEDQRKQLPNAVKKLSGLMLKDNYVYVHCTAGMNRAPLTVLAYMVWVRQEKLKQALERLKDKRPGCEPYMDAFHGCYEDLVREYHQKISNYAYLNRNKRTEGEDNALSDWVKAEQEVIKEVLMS